LRVFSPVNSFDTIAINNEKLLEGIEERGCLVYTGGVGRGQGYHWYQSGRSDKVTYLIRDCPFRYERDDMYCREDHRETGKDPCKN